MANEIYVSGTGDLLQTEIITAELELLLHQRPFAFDLMTFKGDTAGTAADTIKVRQIDYDDIAASVSEGNAVSGNTDLTHASYTLQPGRLAIKRKVSHLFQFISDSGLPTEIGMAQYNFRAIEKGLHGLFAASSQSLTGSVGSTGVDMSVTDFYAAQQVLQLRKVGGRIICHLHQQQFNDFQSDLRGEGGSTQWQPATAELLSFRGDNYKGMFNGVEIWTSDQVPTANAGADYGGAMFGYGAISYAQGSPVAYRFGQRLIQPGTVIFTDFGQDIDKDEQEMVTNGYFVTGVAQADMGVNIVTDA